MAYIVVQPVNGHQYVYLCENHFVPAKHSARNTRTYLGKLDPATRELLLGSSVDEPSAEVQALLTQSGMIYTGIRLPRRGISPAPPALLRLAAVETVGEVQALADLAQRCGLTPTLQQVFGAHDAQAALALAMYQISQGDPLYLAQAWVEDVPRTLLPVAQDWSSAGLSRFMRRLGGDVSGRERFHRAWIAWNEYPDAILYDTTSLSSWSARLPDAEWGYNRDGDALPQVNLALIAAQRTGVPLVYRVVAGSIPDVSTLQHTLQYLHALGLRQCVCVLDKGFYSQANVRALLGTPIDFILGVPFQSRQAQQVRQQARSALGSVKRAFAWHGQVLRYQVSDWAVGLEDGQTATLSAHLYFDPARAAAQATDLERRVLAVEALAQQTAFPTLAAARAWLDEHGGTVRSYLRLASRADTYQLVRKPQAITRAEHHFGYTLVLARDRTWGRDQVLTDYRSRDTIEKLFDIFKGELEQDRLRSGETHVVDGRLFIAFLALCLYRLVEQRLREADLLKKYSVAEALAELRKIKAVTLTNGQRLLKEISKKQRTILAALQVPLPQ